MWQTVSSMIGAAVFVLLMWWLARAHSHMWRRVSAKYGGRAASLPTATRPIDTIVVASRGSTGPGKPAYRVYPGAKIAVHQDGLAVSLLPPLNIMCRPLRLPFDEMDLNPTHWALWPEPFAIRMRGLPDIDIILGRDTVQWLRSCTDRPPFGWES